MSDKSPPEALRDTFQASKKLSKKPLALFTATTSSTPPGKSFSSWQRVSAFLLALQSSHLLLTPWRKSQQADF